MGHDVSTDEKGFNRNFKCFICGLSHPFLDTRDEGLVQIECSCGTRYDINFGHKDSEFWKRN